MWVSKKRWRALNDEMAGLRHDINEVVIRLTELEGVWVDTTAADCGDPWFARERVQMRSAISELIRRAGLRWQPSTSVPAHFVEAAPDKRKHKGKK